MEKTRIVVDVQSPEQATAAVLDGYAAFAEAAALPLSVRLETHLALDEIVSNIARHNGEGDDAATIEVLLAFEDDMLTVDVIDDGIPFDPLSATIALRTDPFNAPPGGFGIALTRRFTEQLTYTFENRRNRLSFRKRVPYARIRRLFTEPSRRGPHAT
jgi:anti-sigma regulatory factor (Ser/Thr protein kinase)